MSQPYTLCPGCGLPVEPDGPGVHFGRELVDMPGFGQQHDLVEGMGGFFHAACSLPSSWRAAPLP